MNLQVVDDEEMTVDEAEADDSDNASDDDDVINDDDGDDDDGDDDDGDFKSMHTHKTDASINQGLRDEPPTKKAKFSKADLYRPPTNDELNQLKETENLFHSTLFRMQVM